jgi:hypothetical protein
LVKIDFVIFLVLNKKLKKKKKKKLN